MRIGNADGQDALWQAQAEKGMGKNKGDENSPRAGAPERGWWLQPLDVMEGCGRKSHHGPENRKWERIGWHCPLSTDGGAERNREGKWLGQRGTAGEFQCQYDNPHAPPLPWAALSWDRFQGLLKVESADGGKQEGKEHASRVWLELEQLPGQWQWGKVMGLQRWRWSGSAIQVAQAPEWWYRRVGAVWREMDFVDVSCRCVSKERHVFSEVGQVLVKITENELKAHSPLPTNHSMALSCACVRVHAQYLSCVRIFATPWTVALQALLSKEYSRQEYWSGLPFPTPEDLTNPGIKPTSPSPSLAGGFFTTVLPGVPS